jgi:NitT/TauT family transport system substrate-binding protein
MISGKIDAGLFAIGDLLNVSQRIPVKAVMVYDSGGSSTVVASPQVASVADLRGQRVAVNTGTSGELFIREMLASADLSIQDVTLVNLSPELLPEKLGSEVQAGYSWEPYTGQAVEAGNRVLFDSASSEVGSLFPDVMVFRQSVLDERPDDVRAFIAAWFEAVNYRKANPEESRKLIEKALGQDPGEADTKIVVYGLDDNLALYERGESPYIKRTMTDILDTYVSFLISTGSVTRAPAFEDLFDTGLIR